MTHTEWIKKCIEKFQNPPELREGERFTIKGNTVIDKKTNLQWEQSGSQKPVNFGGAKKLENDQWRLPTRNELYSLLLINPINDWFIDPIFDKTQNYCWSSDLCTDRSAWYVSFNYGYVYWSCDDNYVRLVRR